MFTQQRAQRCGLLAIAIASASTAEAQRPAVSIDPRDTITSFAVGGWGLALDDRDLTTRPGDDFVRYQGGRWIDASTREGLDRNNSYWRDLMRLPARRVTRILEELATDRSISPTSVEGKAAAFYRSFADTAEIRRRGLTALEPALSTIRAVRTHADLARVMGMEAGAWTPRPVSTTVQTFPLGLFAVRTDQDPRRLTHNAVFVSAAGLLLPAPSYYSDPKQEDIRQAYVQYIGSMLTLLHWNEPERRAREGGRRCGARRSYPHSCASWWPPGATRHRRSGSMAPRRTLTPGIRHLMSSPASGCTSNTIGDSTSYSSGARPSCR